MPDKYIPEEEVVENTEEKEPQPEPWREELANLSGQIQQLSSLMSNYGQPQAAPQPGPTGPSVDEQISQLDAELVKLDTEMDAAIVEGKPVAAIQRKRDALNQKKYDIKYDTKLQEIETMGTFAIDQLTDEIVSKNMPLLDIPEVKNAYETAVSQMTPQQRMNPKVRQTAYDYACGANMNLVLDKKIEERLRKDAETTATQVPAGKSGREIAEADDPNRIPDPSEHLTSENLIAIEAAGKTVDSYYKGMGYDGWEDFWVKTGKAHFIGEEEEGDE